MTFPFRFFLQNPTFLAPADMPGGIVAKDVFNVTTPFPLTYTIIVPFGVKIGGVPAIDCLTGMHEDSIGYLVIADRVFGKGEDGLYGMLGVQIGGGGGGAGYPVGAGGDCNPGHPKGLDGTETVGGLTAAGGPGSGDGPLPYPDTPGGGDAIVTNHKIYLDLDAGARIIPGGGGGISLNLLFSDLFPLPGYWNGYNQGLGLDPNLVPSNCAGARGWAINLVGAKASVVYTALSGPPYVQGDVGAKPARMGAM